MPYKKMRPTYLRKRKTFRRKSVRAKVKRVLFSMAEKKYFESSGTVATIPATWTSDSVIDGLGQGTAATNRIGNKIYVHKIVITLLLAPVFSGVNANGSVCRVAMYHNKEASGALPGATPAIFESDSIIANRYVPKLPQYTLLSDKTATMVISATNGATYNAAAGKVVYRICVYPKKRIDFQSNAGTISDLFKDDYGLAYIADSNVCCSLQWKSQVVFSDV